MDLPSLARDIDKLATADAIVADSYIRYAFRKGALYFLACLLAMTSLVLLGLALYWQLEQSLGPIGAATLVGIVGCLLAGIVAVVATIQHPGREFSVAMEMRKSTITMLEQNVGSASAGALIYPASEALISSVILPLMGTLIRNLKSPRGKPAETPAELNTIADPQPAAEGPKT
ncbi:hypothetical protein [Hyphomicrobium sp.]|uniref:hypothetical protein n=1 Tax=Hyphomicrobium sp. TaxID=82 RepID=UPI00356983AF